ncbi:hypothetical protein HDE_04739 [Halotydeus destructor]|nr:hypothetical protein HDE_04739 [Halotydeus destructor]
MSCIAMCGLLGPCIRCSKRVKMGDADGFKSLSEYVPFYPEDSNLFGINFQSTGGLSRRGYTLIYLEEKDRYVSSRAKVEQIPEGVRHLGSVEMILRNPDWCCDYYMLSTDSNLTEDTEFSVRLYPSRDENRVRVLCPDIHLQVVNGVAVGVNLWFSDGLYHPTTNKGIVRLIVHTAYISKPWILRRHQPYSLSSSVARGKVTLHSHDGHFETCKQRLSSHSAVFNAMFQNNFRERLEGNIQLDYVDSSVLDFFLAFLNDQQLHFEDEHFAMQVLIFSDMFDIRLLSRASQSFLTGKIRIANVVVMAEFAELYNASMLHERCFKFMARKLKLLGRKSLTGFDKITSISWLRQLISCCNSFRLDGVSYIYRSK